MKYLNKREKFIKEYRKINEAFDMSGSGPMGNDINWGDSLLGRLINSSIRVAKIKYNAKKVDTLLKDFKAQLDLILVESLSRDDRSDFFILQLKGFLNQVDNICTSTKEEEEKLEDLLGSSDGNSLWNPKNPMRGKWDDIVKDGLLRTIHDRIEFDLNEEIVKVAGANKDDIANSISELIDQLREYAYVLDNPGATPTPRKPYPIRFYGLLRKYKHLLTENTSFKLKGYLKFIKEQNQVTIKGENHISVFKRNFEIIQEIYERFKEKDTFSDICKYIKNKGGEKYLNDISGDESKIENLYSEIKKISNNEKSENELAKNIFNFYKKIKDSEGIEGTISHFKKSMEECLGVEIETKTKEVNKDQQVNTVVGVDIVGSSEKENPTEEEIKNVVDKIGKNKQKEFLKKIKDESQSEEDKKEAEELLNIISGDNSEGKGIKESLKIYENVSNPKNIKEIWDEWVKDTDMPEDLIRVTQQEIDKLDAMLKGKMDSGVLTFNPRKTPDPIINIIRIFKRAHDLYYTDVIPSGRGSGRVSNKTFRAYEKLGTGTTSQSDANSPGYGPWAVKSIRNAWVDGVTKILEDQEYRKIFANKNFIVAGSEDTFNESISYGRYIKLILEEIEDKDDKSPKSQGKILFEFITDMLSKEAAANFDKERDTLLKKYFGSSITLDKVDKDLKRSAPRPTIPTDPPIEKTIFWYPISRYNIYISNINSDEGPVIMLPYVNNTSGSSNIQLMKFHIIKQIKITGDISGEEHYCYIVKIFKEVKGWKIGKKQYDTFKVENDDEIGITEGIGILHKTGGIKDKELTSGKLKLIYMVNNTLSGLQEIEIQSTSSSGRLVPSVLYKKDGKEIQIQEKDDLTSLISEITKLDSEMKKKL